MSCLASQITILNYDTGTGAVTQERRGAMTENQVEVSHVNLVANED